MTALPDVAGRGILCTSPGRAQFAAAVAEAQPDARVRCHFLDLYLAEQARSLYRDGPTNLEILCEADLPGDELDAVALPLSSGGEAELARDLMQAGYLALRTGGRLIVATDNPKDTWLHREMDILFKRRVTRRNERHGVLYLGTKAEPLKKVKNFEARFAFRDRGRLIWLVSRPGVFSHRRLDLGARALIDAVEIGAGERVFDIGCGSGAVALAAAARAENVHVLAVDSNPRAVQCTLRGAELNGLTSVTARLEAEANCDAPGTYDLAVMNPPYYSQYRIAEIFLHGGLQALKPQGRMHVVTKHAAWYEEQMAEHFDQVSTRESRGYLIVAGAGRRFSENM